MIFSKKTLDFTLNPAFFRLRFRLYALDPDFTSSISVGNSFPTFVIVGVSKWRFIVRRGAVIICLRGLNVLRPYCFYIFDTPPLFIV